VGTEGARARNTYLEHEEARRLLRAETGVDTVREGWCGRWRGRGRLADSTPGAGPRVPACHDAPSFSQPLALHLTGVESVSWPWILRWGLESPPAPPRPVLRPCASWLTSQPARGQGTYLAASPSPVAHGGAGLFPVVPVAPSLASLASSRKSDGLLLSLPALAGLQPSRSVPWTLFVLRKVTKNFRVLCVGCIY
jgi:hypothetical protein